MTPAQIFHITTASAWQAALTEGQYTPPSLTTEGFLHGSTQAQVVGTANRFFQGQTDLVLLAIACDRLRAELRWETVPDHGTFPHLYGPLNLDAVVAVLPFPYDPQTGFTLPPDLEFSDL